MYKVSKQLGYMNLTEAWRGKEKFRYDLLEKYLKEEQAKAKVSISDSAKNKLRSIGKMMAMLSDQKNSDEHSKKVRILSRQHALTAKSMIQMSKEIKL